jgi:RNA polymerase sigma-70 factor (ECF subfamily)
MTDTHDVERYRPRLFGIAYRMLGDVADAQDLVQETFLRWQQADRDAITAPEGWLVAVVSRLAIDRLRRAATERAAYHGPWLPEPIATDAAAPDYRAELASDLSMALLVLLERLGPEERAAFLLRDVFDADYETIAQAVGRSEPAVRQMVHRARERVRSDRVRHVTSAETHERLLGRFLEALAADDEGAVLALVAPDATFTSDGGGRVPAARKELFGGPRIARALLAIERKYGPRETHALRIVNGEPAIVTSIDGHVAYVTSVAIEADRIVAFYRVLNPEKLSTLTRGL